MPREKRLSPEQIITNLRLVEDELAKGSSIEQASKKIAALPSAITAGAMSTADLRPNA